MSSGTERRGTVRLGVCLMAAVAVSACSDQGVCTEEARRAVDVEVLEAGTDQFIAAIARGILRDGSYEDSLQVVGSRGSDPAEETTLGGAYERVGTYEVHLVADGHAPWDTTGVEVVSDGCHVVTARLTARLEPTF